MEELLRTLILWLSRSTWLRRQVTEIPLAFQLASRFTAGDTAAGAITAARELLDGGILSTIDVLGEEVTSQEQAIHARDTYLALLDDIQAAGVGADISLKLTQMGLDLGLGFCVQNVGAIVAKAHKVGVFVCIDMEDSPRAEQTLEVWRRLYAEYQNVGVVLQSYLYRSASDLEMLCQAGATVRLCKGAYKEPPSVAYPCKADVDANLVRLMQYILNQTKQAGVASRPYLAMATHDDKIIEATKAYADELGLPRDSFELQLLYGIRRDLQERLAAEGYRTRVYVPFGTEWYPYYMRRLAERPANVWFVVKSLFKESPDLGNYLLLAVIGVLLLFLLRRRKR